ncbi:hypothetical protein NOVO_01185 [Rickettsiales bacterium Ac37b]|nr:hypothetical protein NOVO_01185 [Rickettsiales bacterium Ac37b]
MNKHNKSSQESFFVRYKSLINTIVENKFQDFKNILGDDDLEMGITECLICAYLASALERPEILALLAMKMKFLFLYEETYSLSFFHTFCKMLCSESPDLLNENIKSKNTIENLILNNTKKLIKSKKYSNLIQLVNERPIIANAYINY